MTAQRTGLVAPMCHHSNGEVYSVRFARNSVTLSSYEADAIRTELEILKLTSFAALA